MARRKLFDRPVDKEMVERAKQVCREYTVAKRELPILEQDLTRLATKRTEEKNKVMQQLYLEKEQELQKMVDRDKEIITLFSWRGVFRRNTQRSYYPEISQRKRMERNTNPRKQCGKLVEWLCRPLSQNRISDDGVWNPAVSFNTG